MVIALHDVNEADITTITIHGNCLRSCLSQRLTKPLQEALTNMETIWRDNTTLGSKKKTVRSHAILIYLYACETWILKAGFENRTKTF